jgi:hypothetical protein
LFSVFIPDYATGKYIAAAPACSAQLATTMAIRSILFFVCFKNADFWFNPAILSGPAKYKNLIRAFKFCQADFKGSYPLFEFLNLAWRR